VYSVLQAWQACTNGRHVSIFIGTSYAHGSEPRSSVHSKRPSSSFHPASLIPFHPTRHTQAKFRSSMFRRISALLNRVADVRETPTVTRTDRPPAVANAVVPLDFPRFRILVIGRANAGKTTLLRRVCRTTESPTIRDRAGNKVATIFLCHRRTVYAN